MIERLKKGYSTEEIKGVMDSVVKEWFFSKFKDFSPPQKFAIMEIHRQNNVLISSPTGTGKTLAAFLSILNELIILSKSNTLEDKIYCIYISPLRALSNDVEKNLSKPLEEMMKIAKKKGVELKDIRIGKRTGDTSQSERAKQLKNPPHILITTPESFTILLSSPKFSKIMANTRYVIIDEIHSIAENKRGSLLSLALERLEEKAREQRSSFVRIGLSATIHPLEEIAKFLVGFEDEEKPRPCKIVDVSFEKKIEVKVFSPVSDFIYEDSEKIHENLYDFLAKIIKRHKTTLIFTNTRSGTERVVHYLKERFKEKDAELIKAHHSSLSREIRLDVEENLKKGKLKCVVSSTSLELGIDIGHIDVVVLIGSPKSVTRAIQRIGRSGHGLKEKAKGIIIVVDRDDLVECVVLAKDIRERKLDKIHIPTNPLDVLCQHIIGMSLEKRWKVDEAFKVVKRSYSFKDLSYEDFLKVIKYLNGEYVPLEERRVYGKIRYYEDTKEFGKRGRMIRPLYYLNVGTIPDESYAKIYSQKEKKFIGQVEEEFLEKLRKGDRFVLGGHVYEFVYARGMKGYVKLVEDAKPTIPSWFSEQLPLSFELGNDIGRFRFEIRELMKEKRKDEVIIYLKEKYKLDEKTANAIYFYFWEQMKYSFIPTHTDILVENYIDEMDRQNIIFHTLFGRRVNDALSKAYGYALSKLKRINVRTMTSDNGFVLILPRKKRINPKALTDFVDSRNIEALLKASLDNTEMLKRRFRHVATRGFLVLRKYANKERSIARQQITSETLLKIIKSVDPDFPLLKEAYREIMEDAMDIENAKRVLKDIENGKRRFVFIDSESLPSPFAFNMIILGNPDAILMAERKDILKVFHSLLMKKIGGNENGK